MNDKFSLYDLEVYIEGDPKTFVCFHKEGLALKVSGENIITVQPDGFSMYSLSAFLPMLPVKERPTHENDWMSTDELIACPDPYCGAKFRIERTQLREYRHSELTKVPLRRTKK